MASSGEANEILYMETPGDVTRFASSMKVLFVLGQFEAKTKTTEEEKRCSAESDRIKKLFGGFLKYFQKGKIGFGTFIRNSDMGKALAKAIGMEVELPCVYLYVNGAKIRTFHIPVAELSIVGVWKVIGEAVELAEIKGAS